MKITAQFGIIIALVAFFTFLLVCLIFRLCMLNSKLKKVDNVAAIESGIKQGRESLAPTKSIKYKKSVI